MIDRKFGQRKLLSTILTSIPVACEQISSIQADTEIRLTIAAGDPDDPWCGDISTCGSDPVMLTEFELSLQIGHI